MFRRMLIVAAMAAASVLSVSAMAAAPSAVAGAAHPTPQLCYNYGGMHCPGYP